MKNETPDQLIKDAFKQQNRELRHILCYMAGKNLAQFINLNTDLMNATSANEIILRLNRAHVVYLTRLFAACFLYDATPTKPFIDSFEQVAKQLKLKGTYKQLLERETKKINEHLNTCTAFGD